MRLRWIALLSLAAVAASAAGPKVGEQAPPLPLNPVNDDGDETRCAVEAAAGRPLAVAFISLEAVSDERYLGLGTLLEEAYGRYHEQGLQVAIVLVGPRAFTSEVAAYVKERGVQAPVALLDPTDEALKAWALGERLTNLAVLIRDGRVRFVAADLKLPDDSDQVVGPLRDLVK